MKVVVATLAVVVATLAVVVVATLAVVASCSVNGCSGGLSNGNGSRERQGQL